MSRRSLAFGTIFLLMFTVFIPITIGFNAKILNNNRQPFISSSGNTLYVGGSGPNNYTTIQGAINDAEDGDTIFVYNGTYYESLEIDKSINLIGEDRNTTFVIGDEWIHVHILADWVNVSGFAFFIYGGSIGIFIESCNNTKLTGNKIMNFFIGLLLSDNGSGNTIMNNILIDNDNAIKVEYSNNNTFMNNYLYGCSSCMGFSYSNNNIIKNNSLLENVHGISFSKNCKDNTIIGNILTNLSCCTSLSLSESSSNNIIKNNVLTSTRGIEIESNDNTIIGNTISHSYYGGIYIGDTQNNIISENSLYYSGFYLENYYNNIISNNTVNGKPLIFLVDKSHILIDNDAGQIILVNCDNITIKNQELSNTTHGIEMISTNDCSIYDNTISNNYFCINIRNSYNINISRNNFLNTKITDIQISKSSNNIIIHNTFKPHNSGWISVDIVGFSNNNLITNNNFYGSGIEIYGFSYYNSIISNTIIDGYFGIIIDTTDNNTITNNIISNKKEGICIKDPSNNNIIIENNILKNDKGITLWGDDLNGNIFYHNNFINNEKNIHRVESKCLNIWDNGYPSGGNYWDNYGGSDLFSGPNQDIPGSDGIGDTSYKISSFPKNEDKYPLMAPYGNQPPEIEIINPKEGYFHFSGIPILPTPFNIIADTISIGGFRKNPIIINATDDFNNREDLVVKVYLNGEFRGNASYCSDWKLHEWFWTGWALGTYKLTITAEDSFGAIGRVEIDVWNFCFLP